MTEIDKENELAGQEDADQIAELLCTKNKFGIVYPPYVVSNQFGLFSRTLSNNNEIKERLIGPRLDIKTVGTLDGGVDPSIVLEFKNKKGKSVIHVFPLCELVAKSSDWASELVYKGYLMPFGEKKFYAKFFSDVASYDENWTEDVTIVKENGWCGNSYILNDEVFGDSSGIVPSITLDENPYKTNGSLEEWKKGASLAQGNAIQECSLAFAFTGVLLKRFGFTEGFVPHLFGDSSTGKSSAQRLAQSVWGPAEKLPTWDGSKVGTETQMAISNDNFVCLDEFKLAKSKTVEEIVYMISNGSGKRRGTKKVTFRKQLHWNVIALSSGEMTLEDKLVEIQQEPMAGAMLRMPSIPVSNEMYSDLHGFVEQKDLVDAIKEIAIKNYGHAGRIFLRYITANNCNVLEEYYERFRYYAKELRPSNASAQISRTTDYFALAMVAADLISKCGLTDFDCKKGIKTLYKSYIESLPNTKNVEENRIVEKIKLFIHKFRFSRFAEGTHRGNQLSKDNIRECAGIYDTKAKIFCFHPDVFYREVVETSRKKLVKKVLLQNNLLCLDDKGNNPTLCFATGNWETYVCIKLPEGEAPKKDKNEIETFCFDSREKTKNIDASDFKF